MDIFFSFLVSHLSSITQFLLFNFLLSLTYIKGIKLFKAFYDLAQTLKKSLLPSFLPSCLLSLSPSLFHLLSLMLPLIMCHLIESQPCEVGSA